MNQDLELKCSFCTKKVCLTDSDKKLPSFCPMPVSEDLIEESKNAYLENENIRTIAHSSAKVESEGYCRWPRIEETIHFANHLKAKTIGIAHCAGLMKEAKIAHQIFESHGFKTHSICCKVGKIEKTELGLADSDKIRPGQFESACNPIGQAWLLDKAGSDLNVVMGLCVGHDSLFFMHSKAPATVLIAKDRVTGHNPVAALYTCDSYYKRLKES